MQARDREHTKRYRETGLGREQRRRDNDRQRQRLDWRRYKRFWRNSDPGKTRRNERARAQRYYERHREQLLAKRRLQRATNRPSEDRVLTEGAAGIDNNSPSTQGDS